MKNTIFIVLFFISHSILSQKKYSKEISVISDNDLYVSFTKDRYYTNGIFFNYRYLSKPASKKVSKKIIEWQLSHEMYSPYKPIIPNVEEHDRPFAGHLFGGFTLNTIFKNQKIFSYAFYLGTIGPNAYGQEIQQFIHKKFNFKQTEGWQYQIQNALSISLRTSFIKQLYMNKTNAFDLNWENYLQLGTSYTNISSGVNIRLGLLPLQEIINSIAYNTHLNNKNTNNFNESESFLFIKPMLRYAIYDATIQGSFLNKTSQVTKEIIPFVFSFELGIKFTIQQFNFGYSFNYNTNKSKGLRYVNGNEFGRITLSYGWN